MTVTVGVVADRGARKEERNEKRRKKAINDYLIIGD